MAKVVTCRPCAGTGDYPPTSGPTCSRCNGEGVVNEDGSPVLYEDDDEFFGPTPTGGQ